MKKGWVIFGFLFGLILFMSLGSAVSVGSLSFEEPKVSSSCGTDCDGGSSTSDSCSFKKKDTNFGCTDCGCYSTYLRANDLISAPLGTRYNRCPNIGNNEQKGRLPCDGQLTTASQCYDGTSYKSCSYAGTVEACVPETNARFCTRLGKQCGSVTASDNCGTSRTVNCGTCGTTSCSYPNTVGSCSNSCSPLGKCNVCTPSCSCKTGYNDCDSNILNGCETLGPCVTVPVCGNSIRESGETCDDGNTVSRDGCSSTCQTECIPVQEICDDGLDNDCDGLIDLEDEDCVIIQEADMVWTNLNGEIISEAQQNDSVLMVANLNFLEEGQQVRYNIQKLNLGGFLSFFANLISFVSGNGWTEFGESSILLSNWALMDSFGIFVYDLEVLEGEDLVYSESSEEIEIAGLSNTPPYSIIIALNSVDDCLFGVIGDYCVGNDVETEFFQDSYDEDDFLNARWDFGDGHSKSLEFYSLTVNGSEALDVSHQYEDCGLFKVNFEVEETERGQKDSSSVNLFVFKEGICVFPIISSPIDGKNDYGQLINFNASQSFVTNCSVGEMSNVDFVLGDLNCEFLHRPGQKFVGEGYNLFVEWVIDYDLNRKVSGEWGSSLGNGLGTGVVQEFRKFFLVAARHTAQLKLIYSD
jgi:cysteine-rich repeat protein